MSTNILLPKVELSFEHLFTPTAMPGIPDAKPRYSVQILLDKQVHAATLAKIQDRIKFLTNTQKAWAGGVPPTMQYCISDGNYKAKAKGWDNYEGKIVLSAASNINNPPRLIAPGADKPAAKDDGSCIYSGAICNVIVDLWAQAGKYGRHGINCTVLVVQGTGLGQHIGGGAPATQADIDSLPEETDPLVANQANDPATGYIPPTDNVVNFAEMDKEMSQQPAPQDDPLANLF